MNIKASIQKKLSTTLTAIALLLTANGVWAMSLSEAKSAGLIGERADGYLGLVSKPATDEVKKLVKSVNTKRKNKYKDIAKNNGAGLDVIEAQAGKKLMGKTSGGNYIQKDGSWVKK